VINTLLLIAKEPRPGAVKTRLVPPFSYEQAAFLAAAALVDTVEMMAATPVRRRVVVLDGSPGPWIPRGFDVIAQVSGGLDLRLAAAFDAVSSDGPALLIGMDTPQLRPEQLTAFDPDRVDSCLGPSTDGGYWSIGFRNPACAREAITGVAMSRDDTGAIQHDRMLRAGLAPQTLAMVTDVDDYASASLVAGLAPFSNFGRRFAISERHMLVNRKVAS
jgi:glycosyltransferase A (GT-A) superfamily protein (DUF2064 family)